MEDMNQTLPTSSPTLRGSAVWLLICAGLLTACESTGPKTVAKTFELPSAYRHMTESMASASDDSPAGWWNQYGSDELNRLVDRALAHNADLRIATLQVAQAKIRAEQARAGRLPSLSAPLKAVAQSQGTSTDSQQNSQLALAASFKLDVWGEQRALVDSDDIQLARAVHARENTQRNTIGSVVNAYIAYLAVSDSILIARENEAVAAEILQSVERRLALGDATVDDLEQQRALLFSQKAVLPGLENQQEDLRGALSSLVGALPGNLALSGNSLDSLQLPAVQVGLPSSLLLGRPDIRMMEARMRAANANIDVARARLLPPVDLSAQAGYSGGTLASLFQPQNILVNVAAALTVSIFDGGMKQGEVAFAQSYYEEMVETYGKTVLQAVREVEGALMNLETTRRRLEAQNGVARSALNKFRNSSDAFGLGATDQAGLLENRKNYQRSKDETQKVKAELLRSYANLSYALGSGTLLAETVRLDRTAGELRISRDLEVSAGLVKSSLASDTDSKGKSINGGDFEVEIPGVFFLSSLFPLWRDLNSRFGDALPGLAMRVIQVDRARGHDVNDVASYRVYITGFTSALETTVYCDTLLAAGHACALHGGQNIVRK